VKDDESNKEINCSIKANECIACSSKSNQSSIKRLQAKKINSLANSVAWNKSDPEKGQPFKRDALENVPEHFISIVKNEKFFQGNEQANGKTNKETIRRISRK
jgi:hypothetical protein